MVTSPTATRSRLLPGVLALVVADDAHGLLAVLHLHLHVVLALRWGRLALLLLLLCLLLLLLRRLWRLLARWRAHRGCCTQPRTGLGHHRALLLAHLRLQQAVSQVLLWLLLRQLLRLLALAQAL